MNPTDTPIPRRRILTAVGAATATGLAGCSTGASGGGETPTDQEATPTDQEDGHDDGGDEHEDGHGDDQTHSESDTHEEEAAHEHGGDMPTEPAGSATVSMVTTADGGQHFEPHVAWIEPGGTVTWELESGTHTATAYAGDNDLPQRIPDDGPAFDSGVLAEAGATFEQTFETPGIYDYVCVPHRSIGMIGTVVVGEPDPHDQPGATEPSSEFSESERHKIEELNAMVDEMVGHHE